MTPNCFDTWEQWQAWRDAARQAPPNPRDGYCADCTPRYQRQMVAEGRCEHPKARFRFLVEGEGVDIQGVRHGG